MDDAVAAAFTLDSRRGQGVLCTAVKRREAKRRVVEKLTAGQNQISLTHGYSLPKQRELNDDPKMHLVAYCRPVLFVCASPALADSFLLGQINENSGAAASYRRRVRCRLIFSCCFGVPAGELLYRPFPPYPTAWDAHCLFQRQSPVQLPEFDASNTPGLRLRAAICE